MNNIFNKQERHAEEGAASEQDGTPHLEASSNQKLQAYLLLLYQSYLLRQTGLEPPLRMALWRLVRFSEAFREKVQLVQLAILKEIPSSITDHWETSKEVLFPFEERDIEPFTNTSNEKVIATYKETVRQLLKERD